MYINILLDSYDLLAHFVGSLGSDDGTSRKDVSKGSVAFSLGFVTFMPVHLI